ncbi:MAG: serine/threonine protein phosphatase [Flavobacteriales bacterium CG_4_10_14_0_2_um_filter_32_8]|nr:MAG: serine/threonine protein phosphatase [Flavobacteriales bacterium CG_4_10_14_0_2_um_filter_32_8]PJB14768.1 MAG: serine/threonine protein phosphatase [Flavobacteriales bacterium CG_4_9_14_3_um_filter_32_8]
MQTKNIKKRLQLGKFKLDTLLNITKGINNNLSKSELLDLYKNILLDELKIGKLLLFSFNNKEWKQELCLGTICDSINVIEDLLGIKEIELISNPKNDKLKIYDVIVPVFHKSKPLAYLLIGDFDGEKIEVSPIIKHLSFIQTLTNIIIVAIENKRLYKENIDQIAIKKEMELASEMQALLFPKNLKNYKEIEVAAHYHPHHLVGGDYYDFIELNSDEVAFCIADVSGKGVPAALLMSNFQASLRALIKRTSSLSELVIELNRNILANANREKFITAFIGKYNIKTRNLQFINAGHNPPLLLVGHQIKTLFEGSTILGVFENLPSVTEKNIILPKGAIIACYTDGVVEQINEKDEEFGIENLELSLIQNKNNSVENMVQAISKKLNDFRKDVDYNDDIALLYLRFR